VNVLEGITMAGSLWHWTPKKGKGHGCDLHGCGTMEVRAVQSGPWHGGDVKLYRKTKSPTPTCCLGARGFITARLLRNGTRGCDAHNRALS